MFATNPPLQWLYSVIYLSQTESLLFSPLVPLIDNVVATANASGDTTGPVALEVLIHFYIKAALNLHLS